MTGATECLELPVAALSCSENRDCPSQSVEVSEWPEPQRMPPIFEFALGSGFFYFAKCAFIKAFLSACGDTVVGC